MIVIRTILQIAILYVFYFIGVYFVKWTHLPLPPGVVGLLLLFFCLQRKWLKVEIIKDGASFLIGFMTLFFIPGIIGIIDYPELMSGKGAILIVSVVVSALLTIYVTSIFTRKIEAKEKGIKKDEGDELSEHHHLSH